MQPDEAVFLGIQTIYIGAQNRWRLSPLPSSFLGKNATKLVPL